MRLIPRRRRRFWRARRVWRRLVCRIRGHGPFLMPTVPAYSRKRFCARCGALFLTVPTTHR